MDMCFHKLSQHSTVSRVFMSVDKLKQTNPNRLIRAYIIKVYTLSTYISCLSKQILKKELDCDSEAEQQ